MSSGRGGRAEGFLRPRILWDADNMNIVVVAVDPGVTTGYVASRITDEKVTVRPLQSRDNEIAFYKFLEMVNPDIIVCEDFEIRPNSPVNLELFSVRLIGVANLHYQQSIQCSAIFMQKAGVGKSHFKTIKKLKEAEVHIPGKSYEHAMDAMRHFMQWYSFGAGYQYNKGQKVELVK